MISRVAEHCFWMSRYLERADNTARILDVNQTLLLDYDVPLEQQWRPVLIISGINDMPGPSEAELVQRYMTWDEANLSSIASSLAAARENARIIREVISAEMWERMNFYHLWMHGPLSRDIYDANRSEFYNQIRRINQLIHGIADDTMAHGEAWEFFQLGKFLERACQTARILDVKYHFLLPKTEDVGTPVDNAHWVAILKSCSGHEPFHKKARPVSLDIGVAVADFLIFDPHFPRSVCRCLTECRQALRGISGPEQEETEVAERLGRLTGWLEASNVGEAIQAGLHETLTSVVNEVQEIGAAIHRTYFDVRMQAPPNRAPRSCRMSTQEQTQG